MEIFTQGTVICMKKGDAVVKECLRDYGEQLYRVDYNGANKILVWISHTSWCRQYYQNVQNIVNIGNIYEGFLWPEDISEMHDDKFGYIVSIISKDYVPMYEILALKHNLNYKVLVAASIHLAKAVSSLSKYGLVIYGFTSFNIDISKGEILIPMDATACVPSETKLAWIDNPRYTAPEVALGAPMNLYSNRFILANLIFQLLFFSHPLEGIRSLAPMNTDLQMKINAGEKFVTTHGTERSSGVFVSEKSLGDTPSERINNGALPHSNSAEYETTVELSRDQNIVYGKIAPQSKFSKMDPAQAPRSGGAEQVITDGGYNTGAVTNRDPKYPTPASLEFQKRAQAYKNSHSSETDKGSEKSGHSKGNSNGQSM